MLPAQEETSNLYRMSHISAALSKDAAGELDLHNQACTGRIALRRETTEPDGIPMKDVTELRGRRWILISGWAPATEFLCD